ncbi:MAG: hypothetical protein WC895_03685 [Candidatus Shapirobacteria bacterium]|jgi:hypothetical protein
MKKIFLFTTIILSSFILSACTTQKTSNPQNSSNPISSKSKSISKCTPENVAIEGYGDKGKRLSNCFVEYPGEPSRQDKSYYILEDICGQFTKEFISATLGKNIIKTKAPDHWSLYNCTYYLDDNEYVMLVMEYLTITNQKKGNEEMGRTTTEDPKIPMRNMVVYQPDGQINSIFLVLSDDKFISIKRSSGSGLSSEDLINFAANIGKEIKNYK